METINMIVLSKTGDETFLEWVVDLPPGIFDEYQTEGSSVAGSLREILNEVSEDLPHLTVTAPASALKTKKE